MRNSIKSVLMGIGGAVLVLAGVLIPATNGHAVSFDINTCWASSSVCNVAPDVTVATISLTQNGNNVDFSLTNSVANLGSYANVTGTDSGQTKITLFEFTYTGRSLSLGDFSSVTGGSTGTISLGTHTDASLKFNVELDLPPPVPSGSSYFLNGETIQWTVKNDLVSNFTSGINSQPQFLMVHVQSLAGNLNGQSAKYVNGQQVPEPATLLLLGTGLAGLGLWRRKASAV